MRPNCNFASTLVSQIVCLCLCNAQLTNGVGVENIGPPIGGLDVDPDVGSGVNPSLGYGKAVTATKRMPVELRQDVIHDSL